MLRNKKGGSFARKGNCGFPGINFPGINETEKKDGKKEEAVEGPDFSKFKNNPRASGAWDSAD